MAEKRGRHSVAELETPASITGLTVSSRLRPPMHLSDAEMAIWDEVVNDQPASAFTVVHTGLLEAYCRHVVQSRILADALLAFEPEWLNDDDGLKRYDKLLAMHERETRALSSAATRLRITRQAIDQQTVARTLNNQAKSKKPWEL